MANITRRLFIQGRVQGVGFRWWVCTQARRLGLSGWVRNRYDGSVEALIHGAPDAVEMLTRLAHDGPSHADVSRVLANDEPGSEDFGTPGRFEQRPSV